MPRVRKVPKNSEILRQEKEVFKKMVMYAKSHAQNGEFDINDSENFKNISYLLTQLFKLEAYSRGKVPILASEFIEDFDNKNKMYLILTEKGDAKRKTSINTNDISESADNVFLNLKKPESKKPDEYVAQLVTILFHELDHCLEAEMAHTEVSNLETLVHSESNALSDLAKIYGYSYNPSVGDKDIVNEIVQFYRAYHDAFLYENHANITGAKKTEELALNCVNLDTQAKQWLQSFWKRNSNYRLDVRMHEEIISKFDKLAKPEHKRFFMAKYPILKKEYNPDGTRKNAFQMAYSQQEEIKKMKEIRAKGLISTEEYNEMYEDCNKMYSYLIGRELFKIAKRYETNKKVAPEDAMMLKMVEEVNPNIFKTINSYYSEEQQQVEMKYSGSQKNEIIKYYRERISGVNMSQVIVQDFKEMIGKVKRPPITLQQIRQTITTRSKQFTNTDYEKYRKEDAERLG